MRIGKKILDFLFGRDPDIFDENGEVRHDLGERFWGEWEARYRAPEYDWRRHSGTEVRPKPTGVEPQETVQPREIRKKAA